MIIKHHACGIVHYSPVHPLSLMKQESKKDSLEFTEVYYARNLEKRYSLTTSEHQYSLKESIAEKDIDQRKNIACRMLLPAAKA